MQITGKVLAVNRTFDSTRPVLVVGYTDETGASRGYDVIALPSGSSLQNVAAQVANLAQGRKAAIEQALQQAQGIDPADAPLLAISAST